MAPLGRFDALVDACHKRSRPIVMTSIAMGAGMLPLALGWGADPSFRSPMAIAVIGGLITSTLLTLLLLPLIYEWSESRAEAKQRARDATEDAQQPQAFAPQPVSYTHLTLPTSDLV